LSVKTEGEHRQTGKELKFALPEAFPNPGTGRGVWSGANLSQRKQQMVREPIGL
jgi:hypothetical protein